VAARRRRPLSAPPSGVAEYPNEQVCGTVRDEMLLGEVRSGVHEDDQFTKRATRDSAPVYTGTESYRAEIAARTSTSRMLSAPRSPSSKNISSRPGLGEDGTEDPDFGVGVFGADGEPLTDGHGNPVLLRLSDLTPPPTVPPWGMQLPPDPVGIVRRVKRGWFGRVTEIVEAPRGADPNAPGLTPLGSTPPVG
jgi:hypothetical protein